MLPLRNSPPPPRTGRRTFSFIDGMRSVAALVILLHHLVTCVPRADEVFAPVPLFRHALWWHGGLATQVFLVIGGFVGGLSLAQAVPRWTEVARLLIIRYLRLVMPAVATLLLAFGLHAIVPRDWSAFPLFDDLSWRRAAAHLGLLQDILGYPSLLAGFWYLSIDWQCHAALLMLFVVSAAVVRRLADESRSTAEVVLPMLVAMASLFCCNGVAAHEPYATYFLGIVFLGTLAGLVAAGRVPPALFWAYVAACLVAAAMLGRPQPAVAAATAVAILVLAGRPSPESRTGGPPAASNASLLARLGHISYPLFLVHTPVIWAVASVGKRVGGEAAASSGPWLAMAVAASLAAAVALHRLVEMPTLALVSRLKAARPEASEAKPRVGGDACSHFPRWRFGLAWETTQPHASPQRQQGNPATTPPLA